VKINSELSKAQCIRGKIPGEQSGIEVKKTVCYVCGPVSQCGINAYIKDGILVKVEGDRDNPQSAGTLCPKGAASRQFLYHPDRIRSPLLKKGGKESTEFEPISWDRAFDIMGERLLKIKAESGPEAVAFFSGYTKWYRPFLQRLAHCFGSPNYSSESSVCFYAMNMAMRLNYGTGGGPDIANTNCMLVWSQNPFYSSTSGVRHIVEARERGVKLIDVGPLQTPLSEMADIHLRIRPGTSGALAHGMANVIIQEGLYDREFIENWSKGFEDYRVYVSKFTLDETERITGISAGLIADAARLYATTKPATMLLSANTVTHHTNGVQNQRASSALIGLTGNMDRKGGNHSVPASYYHVPAGIPTAYDQFAQPRDWGEMPQRVGQDLHPIFCKMVNEAQSMHLPFQIQSGKPYSIRAMVGFGMNYRMWPGSDFMKKSLQKLDFLTVVDLFMTDTAKMADLVLPACTSFERSGLTIYPQQSVMWHEPVLAPVGYSRSDADIIQQMAACLQVDDPLLQKGYKAWIENIMEPAGITMAELEKNANKYVFVGPIQIPYEKYRKKGFSTPSGKMEFTSIILEEAGYDALPVFKEPEISPISTPKIAENFPLILTTGARLPMFLHSQTFKLPWIKRLRPQHPMADINPRDAKHRKISAGDDILLVTPRSSINVKANLTEIVPPGVVNMYHAYPTADVNLLIDPDYRDPISGFPGYKSLLCEIRKC
jgi:anaerobic selenocysteine-containing dehydrogenase